MKNFTTALFITLLTSSANAMYYGPLLTKSTHAGHVAPGYRTSSTCEIYPDKIVLKLSSDGLYSTQERKFTLNSVATLTTLIMQANLGPLERETAPVDGPGKVYLATLILPNDALLRVDLGGYDGGSGYSTENKSSAARALNNFLDIHCK